MLEPLKYTIAMIVTAQSGTLLSDKFLNFAQLILKTVFIEILINIKF